MKAIRFASLIMLVAIVLVACAPAASTTTTAVGTPVATIPPDQLAQKGHLLFCTDFPYPPQEYFDDKGNPAGMDIEIGNEIANRLGLQPVFVNSVFDSIIEAVTGGKCDAIISAMNITADRSKQISQIKYFQAGQSFVTVKGNPNKINTPMDLCGKSAAAESGTTEADYLQGTGDYTGKGLTQQCVAAGKQPINVVVAQKDTDALQMLQSGKVVIYSADSPVAAYYTVLHPDQFELAAGGQVLEPALEGIGVPCGSATDCTNAPLSPVGAAIQTALKSMMADGTYTKILTKWNLTNGAVTLP
ncbi:MAG: ABC transporter substrate-binding protein [Anaerolineales bacterium]|jgi:polar amino acid transport system substrate-binding protein